MRRPRPHIPYEVRCRVVLRQVGWGKDALDGQTASIERLLQLHRPSNRPTDKNSTGYKRLLANIMPELAEELGCTVKDLRLDHNPALILRPYNPRVKNVAARYTPNANDPDALLYRSVHDHHIKTHVRGDGAQRSDTSQRNYLRQVERNRTKTQKKGPRQKPRAKIPSRRDPWPPAGSRKLRSRGFRQ